MAREKGSATGEKLGSRSARATQRREAELPGRKEEGEARERRAEKGSSPDGERAGVERGSKSRQRGGEARLLGRRGEKGDAKLRAAFWGREGCGAGFARARAHIPLPLCKQALEGPESKPESNRALLRERPWRTLSGCA